MLQTPVSAGPPTELETASVEPIKFPDVLDDTTVTGPEAPVTAAPLPGTASDPGPKLLLGQPLPPPGYDLIRRLGGGGMGDVFLAREHTSERSVAIKFLRSPGNPTAVERFLAEVRALARLDNPHIVKVFATDFYRHQPFFTMEYAPGGTLAERVSVGGPFDPTRAAHLIATVARAVQVAHTAHILHRDLKPNNILLGENGEPRVSDFGLAKLTDRDDGITDRTGALGTPSYMPPEQVSRKHGEIGPPADVYGLGATLYHLLTGRPPFVGETPADITRRVECDQPERPRTIRSDIPMELEAIVMKCLEKDSSKRYATPGALAEDLDRFLVGRRPVAPLFTRQHRVAQTVRRRRWLIAGCALIAVAAVAAFWSLRPVDPWTRLEREWKNRGEVILIGEKGPPRWHRWQLGSSDLGTSQTGDGSCSYEVSGYSFLELCPRPPTDRYLIRAKIRFAPSKLGADDFLGTSAGVYFGHASAIAANGETVHTLFGVTFADSPPEETNQPKHIVQLRGAMILQMPETAADGPRVGIRSLKFNRATKLPGPWRPIEVEVTPERVKVRWEVNGNMREFADVPAAELQFQYGNLHSKLAENLDPDHRVGVPQWSPLLPFGIWNYRASIDVKDVAAMTLP